MVDGESDAEPALRPAEHRSTWSINWRGMLVVLLIVPIAIIGWRQLDGGDEAPNDVAQRAATPTTRDVADNGSPTTLPRTTTTVATRVTAPLPETTVAPGRRVIISGEMKPCRFGDNCLAASFRIEGFDPHPGEFVCVYPNSRRVFGFNDDDVVDACLSADQGDTIAIEVDGVVSATISEQNLTGAG